MSLSGAREGKGCSNAGMGGRCSFMQGQDVWCRGGRVAEGDGLPWPASPLVCRNLLQHRNGGPFSTPSQPQGLTHLQEGQLGPQQAVLGRGVEHHGVGRQGDHADPGQEEEGDDEGDPPGHHRAEAEEVDLVGEEAAGVAKLPGEEDGGREDEGAEEDHHADGGGEQARAAEPAPAPPHHVGPPAAAAMAHRRHQTHVHGQGQGAGQDEVQRPQPAWRDVRKGRGGMMRDGGLLRASWRPGTERPRLDVAAGAGQRLLMLKRVGSRASRRQAHPRHLNCEQPGQPDALSAQLL